MCILIFPLAFLLKKEYLNNISFMEVSIQIKGIPETQKVLAHFTLVYNTFALKIKPFKTVLLLLY